MFFERYEQLCRERGESPCAAAENVGLSRTSVTRWRAGAMPKGEILLALARYFSVSVDYLVGGECDGDEPYCLVPIVGRIAAGSPLLAFDDIENYAVADVSDPKDYFYLRVCGDSMVGAGIPDGSLVLIKKQDTAVSGQIVACIVGDESATLKRFVAADGKIFLRPENPAYQPLTLTAAEFESGAARIVGVAKRVLCELE